MIKLTGDLTSKHWIYLKGFLFLLLGSLATFLLLADQPSLRKTLLLAIIIWSFCRFYYFLFYVIENYVNNEYRFSGLYSFLLFLLRRRSGKAE